RKKHPSPGWIRGHHESNESLLRTIEALRAQIAELEAANALARLEEPPPGTENLAQGTDKLRHSFTLRTADGPPEDLPLEVTWDEILGYVGPSLLGECDESTFESKIQLLFYHKLPEKN